MTMNDSTNEIEAEVVSESTELIQATQGGIGIRNGEMLAQATLAGRRPRSLAKFMGDAKAMALLSPRTAGACLYKVPRGGKNIEGKSVRLAEIVRTAYGNVTSSAEIVRIEDTYVVARGMALDIERNCSHCGEVRMRITNKDGRRFNEDMILVTCAAACAKAKRNAIFEVVPGVLVDEIIEECRAVVAGETKSLGEARKDAVAKAIAFCADKGFGKLTEAMIFRALGKTGIEDMTRNDIADLRGFLTALNDGEPFDSVFAAPVAESAPTVDPAIEARRAALGKKTAVPDELTPAQILRIDEICRDPHMPREKVEAIVRAKSPGGMPDVDAIDAAVDALVMKLEAERT